MAASRVSRKALKTATIGAVLISIYVLLIRPRQLRWGATDEELERQMPGDEIVEHPTFNATRALTIEARPEEIWPWIVQLGVNRAGIPTIC